MNVFFPIILRKRVPIKTRIPPSHTSEADIRFEFLLLLELNLRYFVPLTLGIRWSYDLLPLDSPDRLRPLYRHDCFLPLCLARYLPRTMIKHKVTKTTTATTPPIKAWSVPCCPTALGSEGARQREKQRRADEGEVSRGESRQGRAGQGSRQNRRRRRRRGRSFLGHSALISLCHCSSL